MIPPAAPLSPDPPYNRSTVLQRPHNEKKGISNSEYRRFQGSAPGAPAKHVNKGIACSLRVKFAAIRISVLRRAPGGSPTGPGRMRRSGGIARSGAKRMIFLPPWQQIRGDLPGLRRFQEISRCVPIPSHAPRPGAL
jgi:hypothetical protein